MSHVSDSLEFRKRSTAGVPVSQVARKGIYVVVHDVAPRFATELQMILDSIRPLMGSHIAAAVVPSWHGDDSHAGREFWEIIRPSFDEFLLHGYHHRNDKSATWLSYLTNRADEFARLTEMECEQRVATGVAWATDLFGEHLAGFLPPGWRCGRVTSELLARHGLSALVGHHELTVCGGPRLPLATWSWDCGGLGWLGHLAERYGNVRMWRQPQALPVLAIHPADVQRGFLPHAVAICRRLLSAGRRPVLARDIIRAEA